MCIITTTKLPFLGIHLTTLELNILHLTTKQTGQSLYVGQNSKRTSIFLKHKLIEYEVHTSERCEKFNQHLS